MIAQIAEYAHRCDLQFLIAYLYAVGQEERCATLFRLTTDYLASEKGSDLEAALEGGVKLVESLLAGSGWIPCLVSLN